MNNSSAPLVFKNISKVDTNHQPPELHPAKIILCTLNAKYIHASLGLRYLCANMGSLEKACTIREFTINQRPIDIAESLLADSPSIIGFGIYIWNVHQSTELITLIKTISPATTIVIGGPEVSFEYEDTDIFKACDYLITGQADFAFRELCVDLLGAADTANLIPKVINAAQPPVTQLESPYRLYTADDLANRIMYVEASRGCPFKCEFCLSALDKTAWPFVLSTFLKDMESLHERGARQFKFVDRTFNLKAKSCIEILNFFLHRLSDDLFLHFEVIPDKLPEELKEVLCRFPPATLQFEVGIQSFNPEVQETISRRQDDTKSKNNLTWLRQNTNAYIHADLIFGLPGETLASFAAGFNQLVALEPHEIQLGLLKRLRGTTLARHTVSYEMRYSPIAPYQLLSNRDIDFATLQQFQRFARYWDLIANSSRFTRTLPLLLANDAFDRFWKLSEWIYRDCGQTHRISLLNLFELVHDGSIALGFCSREEIQQSLQADYLGSGERRLPHWLSQTPALSKQGRQTRTVRNARQSRHRAAGEQKAQTDR